MEVGEGELIYVVRFLWLWWYVPLRIWDCMSMDFQLVTSRVLRDLDEAGVRYALIGGYALGLWGATRATLDMDLLLLLEDLEKAEALLSEYAYRCVFKSDDVAQFVSDLAPFGQIDALVARRTVSRGMLERAESRPSSIGNLVVLQPEDLIGLKLQALVNDSSRSTRDLEDIRALLAASKREGRSVDWELLEDYFSLFERSELLRELRNANG